MNDTRFVALDVHKETIVVAVADLDFADPVDYGAISNRPEEIRKLMRRLGSPNQLLFCYEAGPCGYGVYRQLTAMGARCQVVAPSLIPRRPGDRVKTDRRDARNLARLLRSGDLTSVWVPDEEHESLRDLVRAREDARVDRQRKRQQLGKCLLRWGVYPPAGVRSWTLRYRRWLEGLRWEHPSQGVVFREYLYGLDEASSRLLRLEQQLEVAAGASDHAVVLQALQALRGVKLVTAATLVAELGDITRFDSPVQLMGYAGLVPREHSSGERQRRGQITKTGNARLRRIVVEASWHYRHPPRVSKALCERQESVPQRVRDLSWKAQQRLNRKYHRLLKRGKPSQKAVVAVARELLGFVWAIAHEIAADRASTAAAD